MADKIRRLEDGSYKLLEKPAAGNWHRPSSVVPLLQWSPSTGVSRYEFEREHTPTHQRSFFTELRARYAKRPPKPITEMEARAAQANYVVLDNGLNGIDEKTLRRWLEENILTLSIGGWTFSVIGEAACAASTTVKDVIVISHEDLRTIADWNLIVRARSWILPDDREAFMLLPAHSREGPASYVNDKSNAIQLVSPRL